MPGMSNMSPASAPQNNSQNSPTSDHLTKAQQAQQENTLLGKYDDLRGIVYAVYSQHPPQNNKDYAVLDQYLGTRESERDILKSYLPNGESFDNQNTDHYINQVQKALSNIIQEAKGNSDAENQLAQLMPLTAQSAQLMKGLMNSNDKNFPPAVMKADPAAIYFMPQAAGQQHDNNWVNSTHSPQAYVYRGNDELRSGDAQKALADASQAINIDPKNADAQFLASRAEFSLGNYPEAAQFAQNTLKINPQDKSAFAIYKLSAGRNARVGGSAPTTSPQSSSVAQSNAVGSSLSNGSNSRANLPMDTGLALRMGNFKEALSGASLALQKDPRNLAAYLVEAQSYAQMGDYANALKATQMGLKVNPQNSRLLNLQSQTLSRLGRYRDALAASDMALESNPKDAEAYYSRAMALAGLGDRTGMMNALGAATQLDLKYQSMMDSAENLPMNSDLSLLFSPGKKSEEPRTEALNWMSEIKGSIGRWPIDIFFILALTSIFIIARKYFDDSSENFTDSQSLADSEGQTEILIKAPLIAGQYQILRRIGSGGMGIVYEGKDVNLERRVAIKHLREELQRNPDQRNRFLSEARLVAALDHPNIVRIYSIAQERDDIYLVFEFIDGKTLQDLLIEKKRLSFGEVIGIFKPIAQALDYAHRHGVVHRDLKPSNIMLQKDGQALVMDFGVARVAKDAVLNSDVTRTIVGTPAYMAPESQEGLVRKESDVYSLAICIYEALSGQLPFSASSTGAVNKLKKEYPRLSSFGLPMVLDPILNHALEPDPSRRFATAMELITAMEKVGANESVVGKIILENA